MINKSCFSPVALRQVTKLRELTLGSFVIPVLWACLATLYPLNALAGDPPNWEAPVWMHTAATAPLPPHDEKTDAVAVYSEDITIVESEGKVKTIERRAYKILRPGGKVYGEARAYFDSNSKITGIRGWCIPAQGKDYEVRDKDAIDRSYAGLGYMELASDEKERVIRIPAAEPGNVVGYEVEKEEHPYILQTRWFFQREIPVKEARYSLQLPTGWEYKASWANHAEIQPTTAGANLWLWVVTDILAIREEDRMPPLEGSAGQMIVSFFPAGGSGGKGFEGWADMGRWETSLLRGRRDPSPEMKQKVAELTAMAPTTLAKMQAIAAFMQKDIRYVFIKLGIGGWQPHAARDVYAHRYGDCKDKATLMSAMLKEIGVDSSLIIINTTRGAVTATSPPYVFWFDHVILGIQLPDNVRDPSLMEIYNHPKLGRILIFDPTSEVTPFGQLEGELQDNYGLLVTEDGGELIHVPQLATSSSGQRRIAKLKLSPDGAVSGDVTEILRGDLADEQRYELRFATKDADRIKHLESLLSQSLGMFQITSAKVGNLDVHDLPLEYIYSFEAINYAKGAGNLLLVRPRVVGNWSSDILEKKEPRRYPVEFGGPMKNVDTVEIKLPPGYEVDELPLAADAEYSFGSYHSKCEVKDGALVYTRTLELKELSVPVEKLDQLKKFYRIIASDERSTAVLKPKGS